jgi:hypothetical protein
VVGLLDYIPTNSTQELPFPHILSPYTIFPCLPMTARPISTMSQDWLCLRLSLPDSHHSSSYLPKSFPIHWWQAGPPSQALTCWQQMNKSGWIPCCSVPFQTSDSLSPRHSLPVKIAAKRRAEICAMKPDFRPLQKGDQVSAEPASTTPISSVGCRHPGLLWTWKMAINIKSSSMTPGQQDQVKEVSSGSQFTKNLLKL